MASLALEILSENPCQMYVSGIRGKSIKIYVHVWGILPTSGWRNPTLVLREPRPGTATPTEERFAEFDFYADSPPQGSTVFNALTPTLCEATVELPWIVHGVRVHGQSNFQERLVRFDTCPSTEPATEGNDYVPIPWLVVKGGGDLGG